MKPQKPPPPPPLTWPVPYADWALFLDFDGTLVELAATPDAIEVPLELPALLSRLGTCYSGALAILTGRSLNDLDRYLASPSWPAAGQHGAEIRRVAGGERFLCDTDVLDAARAELTGFVAHHAGILVEDKGASIALHYRGVPEAQWAVKSTTQALVRASQGALESIAGKALYEVRPAGANKGDALRSFLEVPPFSGRKPLVIGDDQTDEAAFEAALGLGGYAIKVGSGSTAAPLGLDDSAAVRCWLTQLCGRNA